MGATPAVTSTVLEVVQHHTCQTCCSPYPNCEQCMSVTASAQQLPRTMTIYCLSSDYVTLCNSSCIVPYLASLHCSPLLISVRMLHMCVTQHLHCTLHGIPIVVGCKILAILTMQQLQSVCIIPCSVLSHCCRAFTHAGMCWHATTLHLNAAAAASNTTVFHLLSFDCCTAFSACAAFASKAN